jgi:hypothetical protein
MDQLDQCVFVVERRGHRLAPPGLEDEARLRPVDPNFLDFWIGKVLCQRTEGRHRSEDSPPRLLGLRAVQVGLLSYEPTDKLIDPTLVFHS